MPSTMNAAVLPERDDELEILLRFLTKNIVKIPQKHLTFENYPNNRDEESNPLYPSLQVGCTSVTEGDEDIFYFISTLVQAPAPLRADPSEHVAARGRS